MAVIESIMMQYERSSARPTTPVPILGGREPVVHTHQHKKTRRRRAFRSEVRAGATLVASALLILHATAFQIQTATCGGNNARLHSCLAAASSTRTKPAPTITAQRVEPRARMSAEKRQQAISAMNRKVVESALSGVDEQMLELLSDKFLYPGSSTAMDNNRKRPKGRPASVAGAMTIKTLIDFRERSELALQASQTSVTDAEISAIAAYTSNNAPPPPPIVTVGTTKNPSSKKEKKATAVKPKNGFTSGWDRSNRTVQNSLYVPPKPKPAQKSKKTHQSFRNGPRRFDPADVDKSVADEGRRRLKQPKKLQNGMDLHKYYCTDLLTADEEYSLGMKIRFMMSCEEVHEGVAAELGRLPSIEEWASACGFTDEDCSFVATEADQQLRPVGYETMFQVVDPKRFVGNGLAQDTGPGRGRGRVKKPPATSLENFFDDSEYRKEMKFYLKNKRKKGVVKPEESAPVPINRGTPTDFVEMLMTSREAKQHMVQSNMRLVVSIARKYSNVGVGLQDLVQEGSIGLSKAAEKFEPKKGFKFSTYASWWIQQAVFRSIAYHSRTIRLPVHIHNLLNRIRKIRQALQSELGRAPQNEEIAEKIGMKLDKYEKMIDMTKRTISLEGPKFSSNPKDLGYESTDLLGDMMDSVTVWADDATPEHRVDQGLFSSDLKEMMKSLEPYEQQVITARYGLNDGLTRTVTSVAAQMKQSKSWVRSQECRALRKLRRPWYEKKLREHQASIAT